MYQGLISVIIFKCEALNFVLMEKGHETEAQSRSNHFVSMLCLWSDFLGPFTQANFSDL